MTDSLMKSWWILALRGVFAILFGVLAFFWPGITLLTLVALFAAYALLGGVASIVGALANRQRDDDWWMPLLIGLVGVGAAVISVLHPGLTALVFVLLVGAHALVTGMLDIAFAIRLRKLIHDEWLLILSGVASIVFGALVFLFPSAGALALIWLISLYAVLTGALMLGLSLRLRAHGIAGENRTERRITPDRRMRTAHP
jgi:uncharacterized membrane protein HdeD (DUF308 family)